MADVIGMSDVSTPDTGKGSQLKTGGRRTNSMLNKDRCVKWKKLGYKNKSDCSKTLSKAMGTGDIDPKNRSNWKGITNKKMYKGKKPKLKDLI